MRRLLLSALLSLLVGCGVADSIVLGVGIRAQACDASNGDLTPHWGPGQDCIKVSYEQSLNPHLEGLQAGLDAWSKVSCSRLCFEAPVAVERGEGEAPEGWMYFRPGEFTRGQRGQAELQYQQGSGKVLSSVIAVSIAFLDELPVEAQRGAWPAAVAQGLGLPKSDSGLSARARLLEDLVAEPTAEDAAVFCGFYGPGGICALLP